MTPPSDQPPIDRRPVRVLGIDPGSHNTGWGLIGGSASRPVLVDCGLIRLRPSESLARRLAVLRSSLADVVERLEPTVAAVETPFHGASARSALQLAHARGVILAVLGEAGLEVAEYTPATIKKTVAGDGRADKVRVGAMVAARVGRTAVRQRHDVDDALAVALCHLCVASFREVVGRAISD